MNYLPPLTCSFFESCKNLILGDRERIDIHVLVGCPLWAQHCVLDGEAYDGTRSSRPGGVAIAENAGFRLLDIEAHETGGHGPGSKFSLLSGQANFPAKGE